MVRIKSLNPEIAAGNPTALVLPGSGYTAQAPLLYWSTAALLSAGWQVCSVEWDESDREYASPEKLIDRAFELHEKETSTAADLVVAKSLGSIALPRCVDQNIAGVWLTPLLNKSEIAAALLAAHRSHLAIGGTKDRHWLPQMVAGTEADLLTIEDTDHALLHSDWRESMRIHADVASRVATHISQLKAQGTHSDDQ